MDGKIQVDTHYTRSINLERDADSGAILNAYIPTSRALQTLDKIAATLNSQPMPRAWSLVGPYGSGKSSFAVFLAHLLENQELKNCVVAEQILEKASHEIARKITRHTQGSNGYCIVLLTGSPEPLGKRLISAMHQATQKYWQFKTKPALVEQIFKATRHPVTASEILELLEKLQQAVIKASGKGILIIIDELGKFLEYEARHPDANDIFMLQALAEYAHRGREANLLLVVLMHQAFEQYSKGLSETLRNEWFKVQGRYESIPFLESAEQILRVVAKAFSHYLTETEQQIIREQTRCMAATLAAQNALPAGLTQETAAEIFNRCYPLHPVAALILPVLCQKVAQNERTLFSYLGSQEHYGFHDGLKRLRNVGDWVPPWEIFEYFIHNQPTSTTDHLTHRRWIEVLTAIERLGDAPADELHLLKTIGLFNIIGRQGGLKASQEILEICFPEPAGVQKSIERLQKKSLVNYRKFSAEYRIWEGSDFDLELAVQDSVQNYRRFHLADSLNKRNTVLPVVARRYSIEMGIVRYFLPFYADIATRSEALRQTEHPRMVFYLAENQDDIERFKQLIVQAADPMLLFVRCENAAQIKETVAEVIALERIQSERAEIKSDPVAQRELKDRLALAKRRENELLHEPLEHPEKYCWHWQSQSLSLANQRALQQHLSHAFKSVYPDAPLIKNELVNREKTSGQANAAKNKLLAALFTQAHREDLGFDPGKYPAEKSIYRAVYKETGIHRCENGLWQILAPLPDNQYGLYPVWQGIDAFLKRAGAPQPLTALYEFLQKPPYGIQQGVLPLLFLGYYLSRQKSLALYESGAFCPHVTLEQFEILFKRPELFTLEAFDLSGIRAELFNRYLEKLAGKAPEDSSVLDIVKPLAKFIAQLPEYTRKTKDLEAQTIAVRDAFQSTQSPVQLLFDVLPQACGFPAFTAADFAANDAAANPNDFLNLLVQHLNILNKTYEQLLARFQAQLGAAIKEDPALDLKTLRSNLHAKYAGLERYSTDGQGLKAFILRLANDKDSDKAWLESVAAFLGKAPPHKWRSNNQTEAEYRLSELGERLLQLATVHAHQRKTGSKAQATLLRMVTEEGEINQLAYLSDALRQDARKAIKDLRMRNQALDKQQKLALLAELMREMARLDE